MTKRSPQGSNQHKPPRKRHVERIPSHAPAAKDEGPRLLPLDLSQRKQNEVEYLTDLADIALGRRRQ